MKNILFVAMALLFPMLTYSQTVAVKNNLVYDATLTPNLALEFGLGSRTTLDIVGGYNWFEFNHHKQFKHYLVQPEIRFWSCERFNGFFWGMHLHGGEYSIANLSLPFDAFPALKNHRYEGYFFGGGVSIGNQWVLGKRWNFEASIGVGYARYYYEKFGCGECQGPVKDGWKNYFGPTKATLTLVYFIK